MTINRQNQSRIDQFDLKLRKGIQFDGYLAADMYINL